MSVLDRMAQRQKFIEHKFQNKTLARIEQANEIIAEYKARGLRPNLRQIHYQFVSRNWYENTQPNYDKLGSTLKLARQAGLVDWDGIEDRTRNLVTWETSEDTGHAIRKAARHYAVDMWQKQKYRPEVWIEKDALAGVIERPCSDLQVPYFPARGFGSVTELYDAGKRFGQLACFAQKPIVFYLGDHDPSGLWMIDNVRDQLTLFAQTEIEVRPLALTMKQVKQYKLPPNFVNEEDSRTDWYIEKVGTTECWELDALDPDVIAKLVTDAIEPLRDMDQWARDEERAETDKALMQKVATRWNDVVEFLK